ncbi:nitroreductase/quinone reductase family protein [Streptomyces mirabilis]|uniref:nitroreductase/quinone reductase family protein n=1 Tax=Streptomyces mirabilis TaxID=68239 RepID=UPI003680BF67
MHRRCRPARRGRSPSPVCAGRSHPDKGQVQMEDRKIDVIAEQLHGEQREAAWLQITLAAPRFAEYQVKTDRELSVIPLPPRTG